MVVRTVTTIAPWKHTRFAYALLTVFGLINLYLTLQVPIHGFKASNPVLAIRLMEASIVLVQMGIWYLAMRGAAGLMKYAQKIKDTADGHGMLDLAYAFLWLIAYIVIVAVVGTFADHSQYTSYVRTAVVIHNHLPILLMMVSVFYFYRGSRRLARLSVTPHVARKWLVSAVAVYVVAAALFVWHFYVTVPMIEGRGDLPRFVLPVHLLLFTYVLPQLVGWLGGILAILNMWHYSTQVEGNIYRQLLRNFYQGIFLIFFCTFVAQLLMASTVTLSQFTIGIVIIYAVLLLAIVGYLLIYRGTQKLITLESVT